MFREMNDTEALEEAEGGDGGIKIQAGGKTSTEDETESFERAHGCNENDTTNCRQISKYHERARAGERAKCVRAIAGAGGLNCSGTEGCIVYLESINDDC